MISWAGCQGLGKAVIRDAKTRNPRPGFYAFPLFPNHRLDSLFTIVRHCSGTPPPQIKCPRALRQPGHRLHGCIASPSKRPGLHFSPRGEAKCVRGPSGRGASRLARAGVLVSTSSTASKRNEVMAVVSRASDVRWGERQASGSHAPHRPLPSTSDRAVKRAKSGKVDAPRETSPSRIQDHQSLVCRVVVKLTSHAEGNAGEERMAFLSHETRDTNHGFYGFKSAERNRRRCSGAVRARPGRTCCWRPSLRRARRSSPRRYATRPVPA